MACVLCPTAGWLGGIIGGYFNIETPKTPSKKALSMITSATLTAVSVIALKYFTGISICDGTGALTARNIAQVGVIGLILGTIYSIAINYLMNKASPKSCCCAHVSKGNG